MTDAKMREEVVLTGFDVVSPIGVGLEEFWSALESGQSGIRHGEYAERDGAARPLVGAVGDFHPKDFIKPKKNIKVMSRDIQLGFVAAAMAILRANLELGVEGAPRSVEPERLGVVFGCDLIATEVTDLVDAIRVGVTEGGHDFSTWGHAAMEKIMPLWMLKYLPNMPASHISIAADAQGPSNSPTLDRASSLAAMIEASEIIRRGAADVMIAGGCGNRINPGFLSRSKSYDLAPWTNDPSRVPRPWDADRCGTVVGEGSGCVILERREFAERRGAKPLAVIRGFARVTAPSREYTTQKEGVARAIRLALEQAQISADELDHINADGLGTVADDAAEAAGIAESLGGTPVFSAKGHFGNLGSGTGAVELAASLLAMEKGTLPPVRNCDRIAPDCPINVIHGTAHRVTKPFFLKINQTVLGRAVAMVVEKVL